MAGRNTKLDPKDIVKDFIFFFITVAGTFGYIMLILLIFSFMFVRAVATLRLDFDHMLIYAGVGAAVAAVWYIVKMIRKYTA